MRVVAETFAAAVASVNAHRVRAEKMNVSHVPHQPLAREERAVTDLALEITRQHVRRFVLHQRRTIDRAELAVAAVVGTLPIWILWTVQTNMLTQIPVENTTVWTHTLKHKTLQTLTNMY